MDDDKNRGRCGLIHKGGRHQGQPHIIVLGWPNNGQEHESNTRQETTDFTSGVLRIKVARGTGIRKEEAMLIDVRASRDG
jgi:hypothetical protein